MKDRAPFQGAAGVSVDLVDPREVIETHSAAAAERKDPGAEIDRGLRLNQSHQQLRAIRRQAIGWG
jgi:hypothetical protein